MQPASKSHSPSQACLLHHWQLLLIVRHRWEIHPVTHWRSLGDHYRHLLLMILKLVGPYWWQISSRLVYGVSCGNKLSYSQWWVMVEWFQLSRAAPFALTSRTEFSRTSCNNTNLRGTMTVKYASQKGSLVGQKGTDAADGWLEPGDPRSCWQTN